MTRIVAGTARGRPLVVPRGGATRPTSDRVREALFGRLDARGVLNGASVLDLYAGSGALGLEAASRGAVRVVLVDSDRAAAEAARRNAATVAAPGVAVVAEPVERYLRRPPEAPFDLVLLDPPYALAGPRLAEVLQQLVDGGWLAADAVVVVERAGRDGPPPWPAALAEEGSRRYGETTLWFAAPLLGSPPCGAASAPGPSTL